MNEVEAKQQVNQFNAKKELYNLNIELNDFGPS
jgi:hypothetical protein